MKVRDMAPFHLRMPPELRHAVDREAKIAGRSLNAEICVRLRQTVDQQHRARQAHARHEQDAPGPLCTNALAETDAERSMLNLFRGLSLEKQMGLLALLK